MAQAPDFGQTSHGFGVEKKMSAQVQNPEEQDGLNYSLCPRPKPSGAVWGMGITLYVLLQIIVYPNLSLSPMVGTGGKSFHIPLSNASVY